jgi:hypothetical protein
MKRTASRGTLVLILSLTAVVCGNGNAVAQTTRPQAQKPGSATKASTARSRANQPGANDLTQAWRHLARAYQDLQSTPADVKGDTSRLETAIGAAADNLHQQQAALGIASPRLGREDVGRSREYIFNAVQEHLVEARRLVEGSGINSNYCRQALGHIASAEGELRAARAAPVRK